ncbi:HAD family phosphatase [Pseudonocardiaceae bacterium YIM PH 21723]|nr:HAD family phosphatase [Pseudonocardiaceae bacterium YIM PH 21723]
MTPSAVLFDLDGTLVDTEPQSKAAWRRLFELYSAPITDAELTGFAGRRGHEVLPAFMHHFPGRTPEELSAECMGYFTDPDLPAPGPITGAPEFIRQLHADGVTLGVVSSGTSPHVRGHLARLEVLDLMSAIVTAEEVVNGKPAPDGYLLACQRLGVDAGDVIVFEDTPAGVAAARAAGAHTIAVGNTVPAEQLAEAHVIVRDYTEVAWPITGLSMESAPAPKTTTS